jgi:aminoglycoside phosphotransferase family enzyme/predicted kinase
VTRARAGKTASRKTQSLATALIDPACYDHEVGDIHLAETHISWVFLTGRYAYKVKKPVKLPFLDFSTLKKRHHFCREELRLNRRLAPDLYLDIVPIGGSMAAPRVGRKPAFEYAVKMVQFDPDDRLDLRLKRNAVPPKAIASFAAELAEFHGRLPPVHGDQAGRAARTAALDNFDALESSAPRAAAEDLDILHEWTEHEADGLAGVLARRAAAGAHRECHGDLHLENLLWHDGSIIAYDALEFDRALREIDVVSEASFLAMDLIAHGRPGLAYDFLNRYFEVSGDYDGIHVLRFYLVYRALVRAKVRAIKAAQADRSLRHHPYIDTALELTRPRTPLLLVTHGLSGSGKTTITDELVGRLPALRVRSDLERKRLHGLGPDARSGSGVGQGLYGENATRLTYERLATIADRMLRHGFDAIVDATFLKRAERMLFQQVAAANGARFAILDCAAPEKELRRRITSRFAAARDASEATLAVLDRQLIAEEPLDRTELRSAVRVDTDRKVRYSALLAALAKR